MLFTTLDELDDRLWPLPDRDGRQELEIVLGNEHISFAVRSRGRWRPEAIPG